MPNSKESSQDPGKIANLAEHQVGLPATLAKCLLCSNFRQRIMMLGNGFGFNAVAPLPDTRGINCESWRTPLAKNRRAATFAGLSPNSRSGDGMVHGLFNWLASLAVFNLLL